ncbi:ion channel [Terasakiella sp. A23]|uniref:ion channel n=1 Tax=Terasakiella sp. FCG-A23 TaxID=3080561 RepID=UPI00295579FE|nr:ion channel [Terasakiella sp. A23]MDV7339882.1 ion channel [Terasakiella sp. A23]
MNFHFIRVCFRYLSISKMDFVSVFITLGGVTALVISLCSPLLFWAENSHPDANIKSFADAVWLCFMIVTTIGFGDYYPVSLIGRLTAVPLAATGIGVFGTLAGYFGSIILDKVVRQASTDMLHEQNRRIEVLSKQNQDLNETIKNIASENKELNRMILELNHKVDKDTDEILDYLKAQKNN